MKTTTTRPTDTAQAHISAERIHDWRVQAADDQHVEVRHLPSGIVETLTREDFDVFADVLEDHAIVGCPVTWPAELDAELDEDATLCCDCYSPIRGTGYRECGTAARIRCAECKAIDGGDHEEAGPFGPTFPDDADFEDAPPTPTASGAPELPDDTPPRGGSLTATGTRRSPTTSAETSARQEPPRTEYPYGCPACTTPVAADRVPDCFDCSRCGFRPATMAVNMHRQRLIGCGWRWSRYDTFEVGSASLVAQLVPEAERDTRAMFEHASYLAQSVIAPPVTNDDGTINVGCPACLAVALPGQYGCPECGFGHATASVAHHREMLIETGWRWSKHLDHYGARKLEPPHSYGERYRCCGRAYVPGHRGPCPYCGAQHSDVTLSTVDAAQDFTGTPTQGPRSGPLEPTETSVGSAPAPLPAPEHEPPDAPHPQCRDLACEPCTRARMRTLLHPDRREANGTIDPMKLPDGFRIVPVVDEADEADGSEEVNGPDPHRGESVDGRWRGPVCPSAVDAVGDCWHEHFRRDNARKATRWPSDPELPIVVLLACSKGKGTTATRAIDLYTGPLYSLRLRWIRRVLHREPNAILSGKYGVLDPVRIVEPYDRSLDDMGVRARYAWEERVEAALLLRYPKPVHFIVLGGERYAAGWGDNLRERGYVVERRKFQGIGHERSVLAREADEGRKDLPWEKAITLRLGRWEDVLGDIDADALICDTPQSKRQRDGFNRRKRGDGGRTIEITYEPWGPADVVRFVDHWAPRTRGWFVVMTSHDLVPTWEKELRDRGRYVFAPVPFIDNTKGPRLAGDGPTSWTTWIVAARPKTTQYARWGSLPGYYQRAPGDVDSPRAGGKPLHVMRSIVEDYSRPGDLVIDPCAGAGTTLMAAALAGRVGLGAEMHEPTHALGLARWLDGGSVPGRPCGAPDRPAAGGRSVTEAGAPSAPGSSSRSDGRAPRRPSQLVLALGATPLPSSRYLGLARALATAGQQPAPTVRVIPAR